MKRSMKMVECSNYWEMRLFRELKFVSKSSWMVQWNRNINIWALFDKRLIALAWIHATFAVTVLCWTSLIQHISSKPLRSWQFSNIRPHFAEMASSIVAGPPVGGVVILKGGVFQYPLTTGGVHVVELVGIIDRLVSQCRKSRSTCRCTSWSQCSQYNFWSW